ncbi:MAG: molybdate ABC transporter permease subunit [Phycisphaerales bacterium]|nr:molybdate ABC transporter permease subunit [Phycisphaerales bacterium]
MDWTALFLSLRLAGTTCVLVLPLALLISTWLVLLRPADISRARKRRIIVETVIAMPLVLPPTVVGFYLLWAFSPTQSPIGRALTGVFGQSIPFSFWGLVVGSVIYSLPFAVQPIAASMRAVPRDLLDSARSLGAGRVRTFSRVALPLSTPGIIVAMILTFAHTLGEFGIVLMIGGAIPGQTRTASISIYNDVQAMNYTGAATMSIILIAIAAAAITLVMLLRNRMVIERR